MDTLHAWGSYDLIWACPDCDFEKPREQSDPIIKVGATVHLDGPDRECPNCGSYVVASVAMNTHSVYPVETIEQLKLAQGR